MQELRGKFISRVGSPDVIFVREYWSGDSRDGSIVNGDGYHFFKMSSPSLILEAFELYETDDGTEVVTRLPEMENIDWVTDLGFANLDDLDVISERDYQKIKDLCAWSRHSEAS